MLPSDDHGGPLFSDMDEETDGFEFDDDASDRAVLYSIYTRSEVGDLSNAECWALLCERYPDDLELLGASLHERIYGDHDAVPTRLLDAIERLLADARLRPVGLDLLACAEFPRYLARPDSFAPGEWDPKELARRLAKLPRSSEDRWEEDGPHARLECWTRDLVRRLHDRTLDGVPLGPAKRAAAPPADAPAIPWSADARWTEGRVMQHPKFGRGVVVAVAPGRVTVRFTDGERKLASA